MIFEEVKKTSPWRVGAHGEASLTRGPLWFIAGPLPISAKSNIPTKSVSSKKAHSNKKTPSLTRRNLEAEKHASELETPEELLRQIRYNTAKAANLLWTLLWGLAGVIGFLIALNYKS